MSWPLNKKVKDKFRERAELYDVLGEITEKIKENFNGISGNNEFIEAVYTNHLLIHFGLDFIFKISSCESCFHYIGLSPFNRFFKKIAVLNGCCGYFSKAVRPQEICPTWNPKAFWRKLICYKIEKYCSDKKNKYSLQRYFQDIKDETGREYDGIEYRDEDY